MTEKTIGDRIATLRKSRGFTQKDLADFLGVTDKAVSRWESGHGNPDITLLPKLAKLLGTTTDYLLSGAEMTSDVLTSSISENEEKPMRVLMTLGKVFTVFGALALCTLLVLLGMAKGRGGNSSLLTVALILTAIDAFVCVFVFDSLAKAKAKRDVVAVGVLSLLFCLLVGGILILCIPKREFFEPKEQFEEELDEGKAKKRKARTIAGLCLVLLGCASVVVSAILFENEFFAKHHGFPSVTGYQVMFDYANCYSGIASPVLPGSPFWLAFSYIELFFIVFLSVVLAAPWILSLAKPSSSKRPSFKSMIVLGAILMAFGWIAGTLIVSSPIYTGFANYGIRTSSSMDIASALAIVGANLSGIGVMLPLEKIKTKSAN